MIYKGICNICETKDVNVLQIEIDGEVIFCCKNCRYKSNDDRIGAMNLYKMGKDYLREELKDKKVPDVYSYDRASSIVRGAVNHPTM